MEIVSKILVMDRCAVPISELLNRGESSYHLSRQKATRDSKGYSGAYLSSLAKVYLYRIGLLSICLCRYVSSRDRRPAFPKIAAVSLMTNREKFTNPPVVEFILGVQFAPLTKLASGHFGLLWQKLGADWVVPGDGPLIQEQFEIFDRPRVGMPMSIGWRLEAAPPIGKFTLGNQNRDKLLQFQNSRLHLNWRKSANQKPSYRTLVEDFEKTYHLVEAFVEENQIGPLLPNQWELTYVDAFPHPDDWNTAADWSNILPGLFGQLFGANELGLKLEHRAAEWSFEIEPKRARLHISAQAGRWGDDAREALLVTWTARGPASTFEEVLNGLELGHEKIVNAFFSATSSSMYPKWR